VSLVRNKQLKGITHAGATARPHLCQRLLSVDSQWQRRELCYFLLGSEMPITLCPNPGSTNSQISMIKPFAQLQWRPVSARLLLIKECQTSSGRKCAPTRHGITGPGNTMKIMLTLRAIADAAQCRLAIREGQIDVARRVPATAARQTTGVTNRHNWPAAGPKRLLVNAIKIRSMD
jgi:hypothetical protein